MAKYTTTDTELTSIANAIRTKGGTSAQLEYPTGFVSAINAIAISGGDDTSDATLNSGSQMLSGVTAYSNGVKYTGTIQSKSAQTYTPTTSDQTIASGQYLSGAQTIAGDANLVAGNIKKDVTIFGTTGVYDGPSDPLDPLDMSVNFIDYDGTILYSYTKEQAEALTSLPANPSHTGLTAQGWNWTLQQIKNQLTDTPHQTIWVGQLYVTSDGNTRLFIEIPDDSLRSIRLNVQLKNTVDIDWGDGTTERVSAGYSYYVSKTIYHTYPQTGMSSSYEISITNSVVYNRVGGVKFFGPNGVSVNSNSEYATIIAQGQDPGGGTVSFNGLIDLKYAKMLKKIFVGSECAIDESAFRQSGIEAFTVSTSTVFTIDADMTYRCHNLRCLIIPPQATWSSNADRPFECSYGLEYVSFPPTISAITAYAFYCCAALKGITIPSSVTSIGNSAFYGCTSLKKLSLPSSITNWSHSMFDDMHSLKELEFCPTSASGNYSPMFSQSFLLEKIYTPDGIIRLAPYMYRYLPHICKDDTKITVSGFRPANTIGTYSISNADFLKEITVAEGVTTIDAYGLSVSLGSSKITKIVLPSTLTTIGNYALPLENIDSLTIPQNVTSIGTSSLYSASGLLEIHMRPTTPPTLNSTITSKAKIYVPYSSDHSVLSAYQSATNWTTYSAQMVEESP